MAGTRYTSAAAVALVALLIPAAAPSNAAVLSQREVVITIDGDGFIRDDRLLVKLTEPGDIDAWQEYSIWLDEHVELVSCTAEVLGPDGKVVDRVPRRKHRRIESPGADLYTSDWVSMIPFPPLAVGQVLRIDYTRRWRPLHPSAAISLVVGTEQEKLLVSVRGAGEGSFRWRLANADESFTVTERPDGLDLRAAKVPAADPPPYAPSSDLAQPVLRLAWGEVSDWNGVGRWFDQLVGRPAVAPQVASLARSLCPDSGSPRACVEALAGHVKRQVRYEAVEIGKGSWIPTAAAEVLARGWGDCKDKSHLLKQMLAAVEIPSHLVLIRVGSAGAIDTEFAWPGSFNHCILAIPAAAAAATPDDPVADGYLYIDPTADMGGVAWLTPSCQNRPALVVKDGAGELVETPEHSHSERRHLEIKGEIQATGSLVGQARLNLRGRRAVAWVRDMRSKPQERTEEDVRSYFASLLPGARLEQVAWQEIAGDVPGFELSAEVRVPDVGQGQPGRRSLKPMGLAAIPEPRILDERTVPVVLNLGEHDTEWQVQLPHDWCGAEPSQVEVENDIGSFTQSVTVDQEHRLHLVRRVVLRQNLVEVAAFEELKELAVAESRAVKRRIRLRCSE
jgi:transglutaminase-like putative cysteine protease